MGTGLADPRRLGSGGFLGVPAPLQAHWVDSQGPVWHRWAGSRASGDLTPPIVPHRPIPTDTSTRVLLAPPNPLLISLLLSHWSVNGPSLLHSHYFIV